MRFLLKVTLLILIFSTKLYAQKDFRTLDKQTYEYYLKGDYDKLKKTSDSMLSQGIDYYYLRMRLGILAYNNQQYSIAMKSFSKAIEFNSLDTISREHIYNCYLFSGRKADGILYLESIPYDKKNCTLKTVRNHGLSDVFVSSAVSGSDVTLYTTNSLYYEAVKSNLNINAGFETYFSPRLKGTFSLTNFSKTGTEYSAVNSSGANLNYSQNQVYSKLSYNFFQGWEVSAFGQLAFFTETLPKLPPGKGGSANLLTTEYVGGLGISKNSWKVRAGANISRSNFSNSSQTRVEGYLTYLPKGNLNLYFTTGGMYQNDRIWGGTYQINEEIGLKISRSLWLESGIVKGNSFLYSRNQGNVINNSFLTPATSIYGNLIIMAGRKFSIAIMPFYTRNEIYSWDLTSNTRTGKLTPDSFGGSIKLIYKNK
jgi:hypothetical protein